MIQTADAVHLFDAEQFLELKDRMLEIVACQPGIDRDKIANNPALFDAMGADSFDVAELVTKPEEEFELP